MAFVYDATHNGFVTHNEAFGTPPVPPLMTVADQQKILLAYCNAFCRMRMLGEPQWQRDVHGRMEATGRGGHRRGHGIPVPQHTTRARWTSSKGRMRPTTGRRARSVARSPSPGCLRIRGDPVVSAGQPVAARHRAASAGLGHYRRSTGVRRSDRAAERLGVQPPAGAPGEGRQQSRPIRRDRRTCGSALRDGGGNERLIRASAFGGVPEIAVGQRGGNTNRRSRRCGFR